MNNGEGHTDHHPEKNHKNHQKEAGEKTQQQKEGEQMSRHIETRRKVKEISLVADFEALLARCMISDTDKEILRLHYINGKEFAMIGDMMGYTESAVKARHAKALRKLADAL